MLPAKSVLKKKMNNSKEDKADRESALGEDNDSHRDSTGGKEVSKGSTGYGNIDIEHSSGTAADEIGYECVREESELVRMARELREKRRALDLELVELEERYEKAQQRLAAYEAEKLNDSTVWLGTPASAQEMQRRLEAAVADEKVLIEIVAEVRTVRERLAEKALKDYGVGIGNSLPSYRL